MSNHGKDRGIESCNSLTMTGEVTLNPTEDDPDRLVDKLLSLVSRLPIEARIEFKRRISKMEME